MPVPVFQIFAQPVHSPNVLCRIAGVTASTAGRHKESLGYDLTHLQQRTWQLGKNLGKLTSSAQVLGLDLVVTVKHAYALPCVHIAKNKPKHLVEHGNGWHLVFGVVGVQRETAWSLRSRLPSVSSFHWWKGHWKYFQYEFIIKQTNSYEIYRIQCNTHEMYRIQVRMPNCT